MPRLLLSAACLVSFLPAAPAGDPKTEKDFTSLFNGKDLSGWHVMNKGQFSVANEKPRGTEPTTSKVILLNKGSGWLRSDREYRSFELRMDLRFLSENADSGVFVRAGKEGKNWPSQAYQVQTMDNDSLGTLFGLKGGKVKHDRKKVKDVRKKTGEWQSYVIRVQGGHLEVQLNGAVVTVADGLEDRSGYIGLQGEGGILEFKNLRIKELK